MTVLAANDTLTYLDAGGRSRGADMVVTTAGGVYPAGSTPLNSSSTNAANPVVATLGAASGVTTYISGFEITGAGATAGVAVSVTVAGTIGGSLVYTYTAATGAAVGNTPLIVQFNPPIPASAANTAITVTCPSLGAGNLLNSCVAHGFRK